MLLCPKLFFYHAMGRPIFVVKYRGRKNRSKLPFTIHGFDDDNTEAEDESSISPAPFEKLIRGCFPVFFNDHNHLDKGKTNPIPHIRAKDVNCLRFAVYVCVNQCQMILWVGHLMQNKLSVPYQMPMLPLRPASV